MDHIAERFLALHERGAPLLMANAWDRGSAKVLASLGFQALATTSSGYAAALGRPDGSLTRDEALSHAADIVAATPLPVSADLENGFGDDPGSVAETFRGARQLGLAGGSVEDFTGRPADPIYPFEVAVERVRAAADAAGKGQFVLTARAENYLHGRQDLEDTIARLQAFQAAGADVLFAPGVRKIEEIQRIVAAVDLPVSVLAPGSPPIAELAQAGVSRVSFGGALTFTALGALAEAGREILDQGTYGFLERSKVGCRATQDAFTHGEPGPD